MNIKLKYFSPKGMYIKQYDLQVSDYMHYQGIITYIKRLAKENKLPGLSDLEQHVNTLIILPDKNLHLVPMHVTLLES